MIDFRYCLFIMMCDVNLQNADLAALQWCMDTADSSTDSTGSRFQT